MLLQALCNYLELLGCGQQIHFGQDRRQDPIACVTAYDKTEPSFARNERDTHGQQRDEPYSVHIIRHSNTLADIPVLKVRELANEMQRCTDGGTNDKKDGLSDAGAGGFQDGCYGDSAGVGEALKVNHLLAERDDKGYAQDTAGDAAKGHKIRIKIGLAQYE